NAKKPLRLSERCGVSTAEKIAGSWASSWASSWAGSLSGAMELTIPKLWLARHLAGWPATRPGGPRRACAGLAPARRPKSKLRRDARGAAASGVPQGTTAEIEEAFRRFQAASPEPKGELKHINPFTLLVAVVLSAQATDAGVNKATPALFAAADTPEKMAALG